LLRRFGGRSLWIAHRRELVAQAETAFRRQAPELHVGVSSASLSRDEVGRDVVVGTIGTVESRRAALGRFDLVLLDEAHLLRPVKGSRPFAVLDHVRQDSPAARLLGLTATPHTLAGGRIYGEDAPFADLFHRIEVRDLLDRGVLVPLRGVTDRDLGSRFDGVRKRAGEFRQGEVERRAIDAAADAVRALVRAADAHGRQRVLVFCAGIDHAELVAELLQDLGQRAAALHGKVPTDRREHVLAAFSKGRIRFVANPDLLTTGYDEPRVDGIALLRATASLSLYVQMLGRGMRPAEGKADCSLFDFGGNVARHGSVIAPFAPPTARKGETAAPRSDFDGLGGLRICGRCGTVNEPSATTCTACDELLVRATNGRIATGLDPMRPLPELPVLSVRVDRKVSRRTNVAMLRVSYRVADPDHGELWFSEFVCLEHWRLKDRGAAFALRKARAWWVDIVGTPPPDHVHEALGDEPVALARTIVRRVGALLVDREADFPITGHVPRRGHAEQQHGRRVRA
jgi:DNA repair protein RadD